MHIFIVDLILISKHTSVVKLIASCISVSPLTSFFCRQEVDILLIFWSTSFLQFLILHICCKNLVQGLNLFLVRTFDIKSMLVPNRGPDLKRQLCFFQNQIQYLFVDLFPHTRVILIIGIMNAYIMAAGIDSVALSRKAN